MAIGDSFKKRAGTLRNYLQIGGTGGPRWKNNAGVFEARNAADNAFAKISALAPAGDNDVVTNLANFAQFHGACQGRLTLTSATPITTADVTAAGTLYFTPFRGNYVGLHDGTDWRLYSFTERSLALTLTSGYSYDIWLYNNGGTLTLESLVWSSDSARATALALQNGIYVKSGAPTRRYLGTIRANGTNITEDSEANRLVWNYYNRVARKLKIVEASASWNYTTNTWRSMNNSIANRVNIVLGVAEELLRLQAQVNSQNTTQGTAAFCGIAEDATNTNNADITMRADSPGSGVGITTFSQALLKKYPAAGFHFYQQTEKSAATGTTTFYGTINTNEILSGMMGTIEG